MVRKLFMALLALAWLATPVAAATNLLFILDSSNSMWGQVDATPKIEIAKTALMRLLSDLPADTNVGLVAYGHRAAEDCSDIELLVPLGAANQQQMGEVLAQVTPQGRTPIAAAIAQAATWFPAGDGDNNNVVLISDGIETCEGDPCAAAGQLAGSDIAVRVHVVGFDIADQDRAALECIAEGGKGYYFAANSIEGFNTAVQQATVVAQLEPPPPPPAEPSSPFFVDEFDGDRPAEHWTIVNGDINGYIVENGELLMVVRGGSGFKVAGAPNVFRLNRPLPDGDWDLIAHIKPTFATGRDQFWLGFIEDQANFTAASLWTDWNSGTNFCAVLKVSAYRVTGGEQSQFDRTVSGTTSCGKGNMPDIQPTLNAIATGGGVLVLEKRARSFTARFDYNLGGSVASYQTDPVSTLRPSGTIGFTVGQWEGEPGDTSVLVDRVEIIAR